MERIERFSSFREVLRNVDLPIGMLTASTDPALVEIVGHAGFDFVVFDNEHCPITPELAIDMVRAAECTGVLPLIRVVANDPVLISKFLDSGVRGVMVPHIESADQVRQSIAAMQYPPHGPRGWDPSTHASRYSNDYHARMSESLTASLAILPIIESPVGLDNVDEILAIPEVDTVFFGPGDYSHHVGVAGTDDFDDTINTVAQRIIAAGKRAGKSIGVFPYPGLTAESGRACAEVGFRTMLFGADLNILCEMYVDIARQLDHTPRVLQ
jgi:4-hydroxy-2-oxoheptanedioate aldolase